MKAPKEYWMYKFLIKAESGITKNELFIACNNRLATYERDRILNDLTDKGLMRCRIKPQEGRGRPLTTYKTTKQGLVTADRLRDNLTKVYGV